MSINAVKCIGCEKRLDPEKSCKNELRFFCSSCEIEIFIPRIIEEATSDK